MQLGRLLCGSDDHVKWWSCLQLETEKNSVPNLSTFMLIQWHSNKNAFYFCLLGSSSLRKTAPICINDIAVLGPFCAEDIT